MNDDIKLFKTLWYVFVFVLQLSINTLMSDKGIIYFGFFFYYAVLFYLFNVSERRILILGILI